MVVQRCFGASEIEVSDLQKLVVDVTLCGVDKGTILVEMRFIT